MAQRIDALTAARRAKIEISKFDERIKIQSVDQVQSNEKHWQVDLTYTVDKKTEKKRVVLDAMTAKVVALQNIYA